MQVSCYSRATVMPALHGSSTTFETGPSTALKYRAWVPSVTQHSTPCACGHDSDCGSVAVKKTAFNIFNLP